MHICENKGANAENAMYLPLSEDPWIAMATQVGHIVWETKQAGY